MLYKVCTVKGFSSLAQIKVTIEVNTPPFLSDFFFERKFIASPKLNPQWDEHFKLNPFLHHHGTVRPV